MTGPSMAAPRRQQGRRERRRSPVTRANDQRLDELVEDRHVIDARPVAAQPVHGVPDQQLESYRSTVRLHLRPGIGHHRLDRLQPEHLERLYAALADTGLSSASILRAHRVLSRALRVATQRGKVARNVATLVDPPALRRPQTALPPSAQEARQVMGAAQTRRNSARWTVALAVGLRQSEALALQWSDVDLDEGTLSVRRGLHRVSGQGLVYEEPKADRSRRTLALPAPLVEALRAHRAAQVQELNTAGPLRENHDLVFAQPNGRPIQWPPRWHHG